MSKPITSIYNATRNTLSRIKPPFFDGLSVWDVLFFFFQGIYEGAISTRAGSVSFSFFLALFPGIIFIFTLIAYLPIDTFQMELFAVLGDVLPPSTHDMAFDAIEDILTIKRGGLLSVTFIAAMLFATNGTLSLVSNLGISYNISDVKNFWWQYLSAFLLTIALTLLILVALVALIFSQGFTGWLADQGYILAYSAT
ncbi:MAG: YihY/virulence factor BrkB family protein, partial [Schleiferiaceae bacterium]